MGGGHSHHNTEHSDIHIVEPKTFLNVLIALMVLTVVTVVVAQYDFGNWNIVVAMLVASIKASLVIYYFMHGAYENTIIGIYILIPFVLLSIMIGGTYLDPAERIDAEPVKVVEPKLPVF